MAQGSTRLNVTLGADHAAKLALLASRADARMGTLASSLLSLAIDEAEVDSSRVVELLDGIPAAFERAQRGLDHARAGETVPLDKL